MRSVSIFLALLLAFSPLHAQGTWRRELPSQRAPSSPSAVDALNYTVRSQQDELRMAQQQLVAQEERLDLLREDMDRTLAKHEDQMALKLQHYAQKQQEDEKQIAELKASELGLKKDLEALVDHLKEVHALVESLQSNLQQQVKKNQLLEKTLSGLVNSLAPEASQEAEIATHRVSSGETLEKISRKYGVSLRALKEQNGLQNDRIRIGQLLKLPAPATPPPPAP